VVKEIFNFHYPLVATGFKKLHVASDSTVRESKERRSRNAYSNGRSKHRKKRVEDQKSGSRYQRVGMTTTAHRDVRWRSLKHVLSYKTSTAFAVQRSTAKLIPNFYTVGKYETDCDSNIKQVRSKNGSCPLCCAMLPVRSSGSDPTFHPHEFQDPSLSITSLRPPLHSHMQLSLHAKSDCLLFQAKYRSLNCLRLSFV
jgi:hypothetical protein